MPRKPAPLPTPDVREVFLSLPAEIAAAGEKRIAGEGFIASLQHLIILTLANAWGVPLPKLRCKGRPKKAAT